MDLIGEQSGSCNSLVGRCRRHRRGRAEGGHPRGGIRGARRAAHGGKGWEVNVFRVVGSFLGSEYNASVTAAEAGSVWIDPSVWGGGGQVIHQVTVLSVGVDVIVGGEGGRHSTLRR